MNIKKPLRGVAPRREPQNEALVKVRSLRRAMRDAIDALESGFDPETAIVILRAELEDDARRFLAGLGRS